VVGFIFARGGSKGVPRKNIRLLGGRPLIAHAIEAGQASALIDRVIVSTDDDEIAEISRKFGAEIPFMRPADLAQDESPERLAWQHAIRAYGAMADHPELDVFVAIPTTSPLRTPEDVDATIRLLLDSDADIVITVTPSKRSPYYNMVTIDDDGCTDLVFQHGERIHQRHDFPATYDMTTVAYAARPGYVIEKDYIFDGVVRAVVVTPRSAVDIDTEMDLKFAEALLMDTAESGQESGVQSDEPSH
jgi:N,N'-diacetyl-8-epilegionaminate cytidylyltransferase